MPHPRCCRRYARSPLRQGHQSSFRAVPQHLGLSAARAIHVRATRVSKWGRRARPARSLTVGLGHGSLLKSRVDVSARFTPIDLADLAAERARAERALGHGRAACASTIGTARPRRRAARSRRSPAILDGWSLPASHPPAASGSEADAFANPGAGQERLRGRRSSPSRIFQPQSRAPAIARTFQAHPPNAARSPR